MATLAQLKAWRDALFAARLQGVRRVRDQNGEEVEYRSDSEMAAALRAVDAEIARLKRRPPSTILFRTSKGS
ncbi:phage head-tail joining protein [Neorhizobium petrolearium]|uniref:phage head-tail joining protein n=1 Tax=Neorhizobium petrolearium TaxID=515361 RepID=UPI003F16FF1D